MNYGVTDLTTFILGTILIVLLPGPNSLFVMTVASRQGIAAGYRGACGIFAGDTLLMILSATGVASLLRTTPSLFMLIKYAGAAYLAWLGLGLIRGAIARCRQAAEADIQVALAGENRPFRTAFLISMTNPKAILFFVSFFIQFVSPGYPNPAVPFLILGLLVQFFSALYLSALIFGGVYLARFFMSRRRLSATATIAVGLLFMGFAVRLASATLG